LQYGCHICEIYKKGESYAQLAQQFVSPTRYCQHNK
jgi:hypothetical protein